MSHGEIFDIKIAAGGSQQFFKRSIRAVTAALAATTAMLTTDARSQTSTVPEIWLAPLSKAYSPDNRGAADFLDLFQFQPNWSDVAKHVKVIKLYPYFAGHVPDEALRTIIEALAKHHIGLALEVRVLDPHSPCGSDGGEWTAGLLERIKKLGGKVDYIAMDEPFYHWHIKAQKQASQAHAVEKETAQNQTTASECDTSLAALAKDVNKTIKSYQKIFPDLKAGDIEPVAKGDDPKINNADILSWLKEYKIVSGDGFAFFHADVVWTFPWPQTTAELMRGVQSQGLKFGMIYNGLDFAQSNQLWSTEAQSHFQTFESLTGKAPDTAIFQSWVGFPDHVLPESDPLSLSGIAEDYLRTKQGKR